MAIYYCHNGGTMNTHMHILGDTHVHVPHAMNKYNCKTNLEINEQGYMAVKLFICAIVVA